FGQPWEEGTRSVEVSAECEHNAYVRVRRRGERGEHFEKRFAVRRVRVVRDELFELVDHEQRARVGTDAATREPAVGAQVLGRRRGATGGEPTELVRELVEPVGPRTEKENRPLLAAGQRARAECREETGAHQRRLPAPRRTTDDERARRLQPGKKLIHQRFAHAEEGCVLWLIRRKTVARARGTRE